MERNVAWHKTDYAFMHFNTSSLKENLFPHHCKCSHVVRILKFQYAIYNTKAELTYLYQPVNFTFVVNVTE